MSLLPSVKICCISSHEEAALAIKYGAAAIGLVGPMPSGPGIISNEQIAAIVKTIPPPIATFLLTSKTSVQGIVKHHQKVQTNTLQLVDTLQEGTYAELRKALPTIMLVQVIHVLGPAAIKEAIVISKEVDAILLDSGNPNLSIKELGGTGRTHNWQISRAIKEAVNIPIFLAGGLKPSNVQAAIETVQPFGLDLCSGVRTNGQLDEVKLKAFFEQIKVKGRENL